MPEEPPPYSSCGTHAAGWVDGTHPDSGSAVAKVCYHWTPGVCWQSNDVTITNCGNYYVYYLTSPPGCSYKYCGMGDPDQPDTPKPSNKPSMKPTMAQDTPKPSNKPSMKPTMAPTKEHGGFCYSARSTMKVRYKDTNKVMNKKLKDVRVGDEVMAYEM
jgi:hypothetical protein